MNEKIRIVAFGFVASVASWLRRKNLITFLLTYIPRSMVFRAIILKRGYAWSALMTTTTMS